MHIERVKEIQESQATIQSLRREIQDLRYSIIYILHFMNDVDDIYRSNNLKLQPKGIGDTNTDTYKLKFVDKEYISAAAPLEIIAIDPKVLTYLISKY